MTTFYVLLLFIYSISFIAKGKEMESFVHQMVLYFMIGNRLNITNYVRIFNFVSGITRTKIREKKRKKGKSSTY